MRPDLIPKKEMLRMVGMQYPAVWRRIRHGLFPRGVFIGNRSWWIREEVETWLTHAPRQNFACDTSRGLRNKPLVFKRKKGKETVVGGGAKS